jgi:redox-sensitive bicupin YhaK (pirin superfamily)
MTAADVQWMTAGNGTLHQEVPKGYSRGRMHGFQLWVKSARKPEDDRSALSGHSGSAIPEITDDDETRVRVICGEFWGKSVYLRSLSR